jgi:rubrerythrin
MEAKPKGGFSMGRNIFAPDEVLRLAIEIEKDGEAFYSGMVGKVEGKLKEVMEFLANEEKRHGEIFETLLEKYKDKEIVESYPGEYEAYMNAIAEELLFTKDLVKEKVEKGFGSLEELFDFALNIERDSIILYKEMKENILKGEGVLDEIIEEERRHFVAISSLKRKHKGDRNEGS